MITIGMYREDHAEDCDPDDDCDCETDGFRTSSCDGCGESCHGARYAYTWHCEQPTRDVHAHYLMHAREAHAAGEHDYAARLLRIASLVRRDMAAVSKGVRRFEDKRYRIVTPYTAPDRFTDIERELFDAGKCSWQTAYGMPYTEYCGRPSKKGASFGNCAEHESELLTDYFPDGTPRYRY